MATKTDLANFAGRCVSTLSSSPLVFEEKVNGQFCCGLCKDVLRCSCSSSTDVNFIQGGGNNLVLNVNGGNANIYNITNSQLVNTPNGERHDRGKDAERGI